MMQVLASLGHSCCPSCGNRPRFQRESLYQGVFYPGSDTKYQNLKFNSPLPPMAKPALELIDLAGEDEEVVTSTMQEGVTDKVVEAVKEKEEEGDIMEEMEEVHNTEEEERAAILSPEVEVIEDKESRDLVVFGQDEEMFKEEETVACIKFGFSGTNRDSGFSSLNSSEVELELDVEDDDGDDVDKENDKREEKDHVAESTDDILARYKSVNMDLSVELPEEILSIEYLRDSTITVDLADNMLNAAFDLNSENLKEEEKNQNAEEKDNSVIELDTTFDDSAIDVDTPEKDSEDAVISDMDEFTKKLVTLNRKHRNEIREDFGREKGRNVDERGSKPPILLETVGEGRKKIEGQAEEIILLENESISLSQETHTGKDNEFEKGAKERFHDDTNKEKAERKKKAKRVSWQDETGFQDSQEIKDQLRKRDRSRSQDSQEDEEDLKDDQKRKPKEKSEKKRKGEYKKMRKRDRSCSQDSQEEEEEEEEMTSEERKSYEERVRENLRKIKKRPIQERKIVHGRNSVSL